MSQVLIQRKIALAIFDVEPLIFVLIWMQLATDHRPVI